MTEAITDFERTCRICFTPINVDPISLMGTILMNKQIVTISSALQEIYPFSLEITKRDDCLPKNICLECLNNLKTSYRFRKICEKNNRRILKILSEHDDWEKENLQKSKHYKYNITKCQYFKDLMVKSQALLQLSDCSEDKDTDFKDDISETIKGKAINVKLDNEVIEIKESIFKKEILSFEQESVTDKFQCQNCSITFRSISALQDHKKSHENKYQCSLCAKKFSTEHTLELHKYRHTSNSNFTHLCPECGKKFLTSAELVRHRRTHVNIKLYQCDICLKKFSQCHSLKLHKMRHSGYKPNVCETCDKRFSTIGNLNEHKITHMTEKPHKCKICAKTWISSSDLKKHMRTHSGEKPYRCQYCKRRFARRETMKVHIRTHTGEKPYSCNACNKKFVHLSSLDKHNKSRCSVHYVETPLNI